MSLGIVIVRDRGLRRRIIAVFDRSCKVRLRGLDGPESIVFLALFSREDDSVMAVSIRLDSRRFSIPVFVFADLIHVGTDVQNCIFQRRGDVGLLQLQFLNVLIRHEAGDRVHFLDIIAFRQVFSRRRGKLILEFTAFQSILDKVDHIDVADLIHRIVQTFKIRILKAAHLALQVIERIDGRIDEDLVRFVQDAVLAFRVRVIRWDGGAHLLDVFLIGSFDFLLLRKLRISGSFLIQNSLGQRVLFLLIEQLVQRLVDDVLGHAEWFSFQYFCQFVVLEEILMELLLRVRRLCLFLDAEVIELVLAGRVHVRERFSHTVPYMVFDVQQIVDLNLECQALSGILHKIGRFLRSALPDLFPSFSDCV